MKNFLCIISVLILAYIICLPVNAASLPPGIEPQITVGGKVLQYNEFLYNTRALIVYGEPSDVPGNEMRDGYNRYLGFDALGNEFTNILFPNDADSGRAPWEKNWIRSPWPPDNTKTTPPLYNYWDTSHPQYQKAVEWLGRIEGVNPATNELAKWRDKNPALTGEDLITKLKIQSPPASSWNDPIIDYLPVSVVGWHQNSDGSIWYQTFVIYPRPVTTPADPNLKVEIKHLESDVSSGYPTSPNFSAMGTPPFKFNAKVVVTLVDNTNWPPATDTTQIPLWFGYDRFGVRAYDDNTNFITPADLRNTGDTKEFTFEWEADYGDSIYLWAVVNPPNPDEDIPYPIGSLDINAAGPRAIGESGYNNNIADVSLNIGSLPAGTHEYKSFEYIYNRINQPIKVDTDTLYTYKQNKIIMETSTYVNTVKVTFNDNYTVTLTKDGGVSQSDRYIHNASLNVSKQTILPALDTPVFSRTAQEKLVWTFAFDLENYTVYIEPKANEIQFDRLKFEAFDHNGKSAKFGYAEINPLYYYVVVRQTKLFNFRVTDVKDIYWKYVFSDSSGNHILYNSDGSAKFRDLREKESEKTKPPFGITKLPLAGNESSSSRLISKGYAVQCRVDAEGLYRSGDSLVVLPSFWWYNGTGFDEVDLYFDITNDNLYNVPIPVIQNGITGGENYLIKDMDDLIDLSRAEFNRRLDRVLTAFPASERSAKRTEYNNIMFKQEGGKYSLKLDYGLLDVKYNEDRYFENKTSDPRMLLEGTSPWEFRGNGKTGIKLDDDNYFEDYASYRNTWAFTYSLHPRVKAIPKGANPLDPVAGKPLTGAILVNLKMVTMNSFDRELTSYNYTKFEDTWNTSNGSAPLNFTTPYDTGAGGHGNAFYFNLDWSALDDYSTQQKW